MKTRCTSGITTGRFTWACLGLALLPFAARLQATETAWIDLSAAKALEHWKQPTGDWYLAESVEVDPQNQRLLRGKPGEGILVNGPQGRTRDLVTKEKFGDVEAHVEFLIPKGSNSGIKFHAHYEIQIYDSHGKQPPKADDCGGVYPRAELLPRYRYLDEGIPPKVNAAKPPGEWQALDVLFKAPRFDKDGKKTQNARFVKVTLNGQVIHENVELHLPTGHAWKNPEVPAGPLLLQADHGPIAFRNVRARSLKD